MPYALPMTFGTTSKLLTMYTGDVEAANNSQNAYHPASRQPLLVSRCLFLLRSAAQWKNPVSVFYHSFDLSDTIAAKYHFVSTTPASSALNVTPDIPLRSSENGKFPVWGFPHLHS